jgi:hypothetical protein
MYLAISSNLPNTPLTSASTETAFTNIDKTWQVKRTSKVETS